MVQFFNRGKLLNLLTAISKTKPYLSVSGTLFGGTVGVINGRSLVIPDSLVLGTSNVLSSYPALACNDAVTTFQRCFNKIDIPLGATVDITLVDNDSNSTLQNSFHLHGYKFELLYQGLNLTESQDDSFLTVKCPSKRDTVAVPAGGVTRIRFVANNAGLWLLRTMNSNRYFVGMGIVLNVGSTDDLPPPPPNFPQCPKPNFEPAGGGGDDVEILDLNSSESSSSSSSSQSSSSSSSQSY